MWFLTIIGGLGIILFVALAVYIVIALLTDEHPVSMFLTLVVAIIMFGIMFIGVGFYGW